MKNGPEPNYNAYQSSNHDLPGSLSCSQKVMQIHHEITKKYKNNDMVLEEHELDNNSHLTSEIKDSLRKYLEIKGNIKEFRNPTIVIGDKQFKRKKVIKKVILPNDYHISALQGAGAAFTKRFIPANTVIGEYTGSYTTEKEWNDVFSGSRKDISNGSYVFSFKVQTDKGIETIFIDPVEAGFDKGNNPMIVLFINDIRQNILIKEATEQDKERENACFFVVKVNGWPHVFVITTKDIARNKELLIDYGDSYCAVMQDQMQWKRISKTCDKILNQTIGKAKAKDLNNYGMNEDNRIYID